jgi:hypothetical protein
MHGVVVKLDEVCTAHIKDAKVTLVTLELVDTRHHYKQMSVSCNTYLSKYDYNNACVICNN